MEGNADIVYIVNLALFLDFFLHKLHVIKITAEGIEVLASMRVNTTMELWPVVRLTPETLCDAKITITVLNDAQSVWNSPLALLFQQPLVLI